MSIVTLDKKTILVTGAAGFIGSNLVKRIYQEAPSATVIGTDNMNGEDGLPIPPYAVYNIGNQNPENLLDFVQVLSEELVRAEVLPEDYDFEAHKELVPM